MIVLAYDHGAREMFGQIKEYLKEHYNITLRPNRIDIQFPGVQPGKMVEVLQKMQSIFKEVSDILENPLGNRLAYVTSFFTFDDDGLKMDKLIPCK